MHSHRASHATAPAAAVTCNATRSFRPRAVCSLGARQAHSASIPESTGICCREGKIGASGTTNWTIPLPPKNWVARSSYPTVVAPSSVAWCAHDVAKCAQRMQIIQCRLLCSDFLFLLFFFCAMFCIVCEWNIFINAAPLYPCASGCSTIVFCSFFLSVRKKLKVKKGGVSNWAESNDTNDCAFHQDLRAMPLRFVLWPHSPMPEACLQWLDFRCRWISGRLCLQFSFFHFADKQESHFSRSCSSSTSSLDNLTISREPIKCMQFAEAFTKKGGRCLIADLLDGL